MNCILRKDKLDSLKILLDFGARSYIVLEKYKQNMLKKKTTPLHWKTQGGEFRIKHQSKVEILSSEIYAAKRMT